MNKHPFYLLFDLHNSFDQKYLYKFADINTAGPRTRAINYRVDILSTTKCFNNSRSLPTLKQLITAIKKIKSIPVQLKSHTPNLEVSILLEEDVFLLLL